MIVQVTMAERKDPIMPDYDLCTVEAIASGLELVWRFLDGAWRKVSARKVLPARSVSLNLGDGNFIHISDATQFTVNVGGSTSSGSGTASWTTP